MITIYGSPGCVFCIRAKQLCGSKEIPFEYFNLGDDIPLIDIQERIGAPVRTVPQIFDGDKYIGGYQELVSYLEG